MSDPETVDLVARAIKNAIIYDTVKAFHSLVRTHADSRESVSLYKAMHAMPDEELSRLNDVLCGSIAGIASKAAIATLSDRLAGPDEVVGLIQSHDSGGGTGEGQAMTVDLDKLEALIGAHDAALEKLRSTFVNDDDEWEAAWREVRDAEHIIRNFMFAKSASIAAELRAAEDTAEVLNNARKAIASLGKGGLGYVDTPNGGWPIRDELLAKIDKALKEPSP